MKALGKVLRGVAIVSMGLTAVFNLLAGAGTTCAAFLTEQFESMMPIYDYRWLYQIFVVLTIAVGIVGIWAMVGLVRYRDNSYRNALIVLFIGVVLNGIHFYASDAIRGKAAPVNMIFFINLITFLLFLFLRIPGIYDYVKFTADAERRDKKIEAGIAVITAGIVVLTTYLWVGPTHQSGGQNWVLEFITPLMISGIGLVTTGMFFLLRAGYKKCVWANQIRLGQSGQVLQAGLRK